MRWLSILAAPVLVAVLGLSACLSGCTENDAPHDTPASTGPFDTGVDTGAPVVVPDATSDSSDAVPPECFTNPKTHFEIINACTDAARIDKHPTGLPFLPDGGLPPPP
jgi:hypothetical protein